MFYYEISFWFFGAFPAFIFSIQYVASIFGLKNNGQQKKKENEKEKIEINLSFVAIAYYYREDVRNITMQLPDLVPDTGYGVKHVRINFD